MLRLSQGNRGGAQQRPRTKPLQQSTVCVIISFGVVVVMAALKLNVGCGLIAPRDWVNVDRSPALRVSRLPVINRLILRTGLVSSSHNQRWPENVIVMDVTKGLPYASASVDTVYSSHMLEHIYLDQAEQLIREFYRVLRPDGLCRLALPDGEALARRFIAELDAGVAHASLQYNQHLHGHPLTQPRGVERYLSGFIGAVHRWQPTPQLVESMLTAGGFQGVERRTFRVGSCPDLETIETREESFFLEALRGW